MTATPSIRLDNLILVYLAFDAAAAGVMLSGGTSGKQAFCVFVCDSLNFSASPGST